MLSGGIKFFFGFLRFYSSGATLLALLDRLDPPGIDVAERLRGGDTPAQLLGRFVAPLGHVGDLVSAARAEHDPDNRLGAAAMTLAGLAAAEEASGFPGGALPGDTDIEEAGSFEDVSGTHRASVETLAEREIFDGTGCAPGRFCPDLPIQRWVMAVWLVRALDGTDPASADPTQRFADVDEGAWWAVHVERLAELGITQGCATDPARFCPDSPVTRAQMATFLDPRSRPRRYGPARELGRLLAAGPDTQQLGEDPTQPLVFGITGWGNSVIVSTMAFPTHTPHIVAQSARPHPAYSQLQTSSTYAQN